VWWHLCNVVASAMALLRWHCCKGIVAADQRDRKTDREREREMERKRENII